jgi:small basic protein
MVLEYLGGFLYAIIGYIKASVRDNEKFDVKKFIASVAIGIVSAFILSFLEVEIDILSDAGLVAIIQNFINIFREAKQAKKK